MSVSREVVIDLLPLVAAGEASPASVALVEEYLRRDPELAARARALGTGTGAASPAAAAPMLETELQTIRRTRRMLTSLRWLLGGGLSLTAMAISMEATFTDGRLVEFHFLLRDFPLLWIPLIAGIACLTGYFVLRGRLRYSSR